MGPGRARRTPDDARRRILEAAAELLAEGGVAAVQVRAVAARVGMTDAGVGHHFGGRRNLLEELLRHGGRRLRAAVDEVLHAWLERGADLRELVDALAALYRQGYGALAVALHAAGWRDDGAGMLAPVVDALHALRTTPAPIDDTRLAVAALHQAMAVEPLYGEAFRRSAGLTDPPAGPHDAVLAWWTRHLAQELDLPAGGLPPPSAARRTC